MQVLNKRTTNYLDTVSIYLCAILGFAIPTSTALTNIAVVSLILLLPFTTKFNKNYIKSPICISIFLMIGINLILSIGAIDNINNSLNTILRTSRLLLIPIIAMYLTDERSKNIALVAFIAGALLGSMQYICAFKFKGYYSIESETITGIQVYKDRIFTSAFLAYIFFMCYILAQNSIHRNKLYLIATIAFLFLFFGIDGRTGHIVFYSLIATLLILNFNKKNIIMAIALIICSIFILKLNNFTNRWDEISPEINSILKTNNKSKYSDNDQLSLKDYTLQAINTNFLENTNEAKSTSLIERFQFVQDAIEFIKIKPILGWGTGSYSKVQQQFHPLRSSDNPHNQYLLILTENGILGALCLVFMFWQMFKLSLRLPKPEKDMAIGMLVTIMIGSLANSWLMDFTSIHFFVFILGLSYNKYLDTAKKQNER